jgi:hypothetical protein
VGCGVAVAKLPDVAIRHLDEGQTVIVFPLVGVVPSQVEENAVADGFFPHRCQQLPIRQSKLQTVVSLKGYLLAGCRLDELLVLLDGAGQKRLSGGEVVERIVGRFGLAEAEIAVS